MDVKIGAGLGPSRGTFISGLLRKASHIPVTPCRGAWRRRHRASHLYERIKSIHSLRHSNTQLSLLHSAAAYCPVPALQVLIDAGADISLFIKNRHSKLKCTPLDCAVAMLKLDAVGLLIKYYNVLKLFEKQICSRKRGWSHWLKGDLEGPYEIRIRILLESAIDRNVDISGKAERLERFKENSCNKLCALTVRNGNVPTRLLLEYGELRLTS